MQKQRLPEALHASVECSSAYPGPDMGMSCLPDSVMWLHSKSLLASISASAMVFSVFCMAIMLMPQCDKCSACRQHADMYSQQCDTSHWVTGAYSLQAMCKQCSHHHQQCDAVPGAACACIQRGKRQHVTKSDTRSCCCRATGTIASRR